MKRLAVLSAAIISVLSATAVASAQYPPPEDVPVVSVSDPTPATNSIVTITWSIDDALSALPPGESLRQGLLTISLQTQPAVCQPAIASQPGTDASLSAVNETSAADGSVTGTADLYTGSTPGPIVVRISCLNGATAQVTVLVEGGTPTPGQTAAPGQTVMPGQAGTPRQPDGAVTPLPPKTGSLGDGGGVADGLGGSFSTAVLLVALLGLSSVIVGARLLTRRGRRAHGGRS